MVSLLAAGFHVQLVYAPVLQVVTKGQDAHFLHKVQLSRSIEVQDGGEGARMAVKEKFVSVSVVVITKFQNLVLCEAVPESAQSRAWQAVQSFPPAGGTSVTWIRWEYS